MSRSLPSGGPLWVRLEFPSGGRTSTGEVLDVVFSGPGHDGRFQSGVRTRPSDRPGKVGCRGKSYRDVYQSLRGWRRDPPG